MAILNTLTNDPQLSTFIVLLVISLLSLIISLTALLINRQSNQRLQHKLIEQEDYYQQLEQLQHADTQRHQQVDLVVEDLYVLVRSNSKRLDDLQDHPAPSSTLTADAPSQSNYKNAIRMAKEGMSGEKIQHLYGLTEAEVKLILDLHQ